MPEQFGDKRHDATPYRRQKAREQGQVARSQDLSSAVMLLAALVGLMLLGEQIAVYLGTTLQQRLEQSPSLDAELTANAGQLQYEIWRLLQALAPILALLFLAAVVVHIAQTGFLFLPQKLGLDWSRLSPLAGFRRIFSLPSGMRLLFGLFKIVVILIVAAISLWMQRGLIVNMSQLGIRPLTLALLQISWSTCLHIAIVLLLLALLDFAFQRWKHEQDLRMTDQELRDELKNLQGDPQVAARRRMVQRQLVMNRLSGIVPTADVVVTNPTELAVAIRYDFETMAAPVVVAKGSGLLAQRIRRLALENSVPIVERKELARALYKQVDVNQPIPTEQYAAVAEVLRYVYELKGKTIPRAG